MKKKIFTVAKATEPNAKTIKRAIDWNEDKRKHYQTLNDYYEGEHPILKRAKAESMKNNKEVINHAEYITDLFVGYLVGKPVEYSEAVIGKEIDINPVLEQYEMQTIEDLDTDIATDLVEFFC